MTYNNPIYHSLRTITASARRVAEAYLRDLSDSAFIPPFMVNREIKTWKSLGSTDEYIIHQIARTFKVNERRAQRMLSEYYNQYR